MGGSCVLDTANSYSPMIATPIPNNNPGNGSSDATLNGFALTAGTYYKFLANVGNDSAGMEQFFVIPTASAVPEPKYAFTLLLASLVVAWTARHKRKTRQLS